MFLGGFGWLGLASWFGCGWVVGWLVGLFDLIVGWLAAACWCLLVLVAVIVVCGFVILLMGRWCFAGVICL